MYLPMRELATTTILSRSAMPDLESTGTVPSAGARLAASDRGPQLVQSLASAPAASVAELLFEATAAAKVWTSHVAMRLDRGTRDRFFRQLDRLHDIEEWTEDGEPLRLVSYKTFVRAILSLGLDERPALALMSSGNLLAIWNDVESKLTIEFKAHDRVRWLLTEKRDGQIDRLAGDTGLAGLKLQLVPHATEKWFS